MENQQVICLLGEAELRILSAFFPEGAERTTKEIEGRSGYSHERVHSMLNTLEGKEILSRRSVGKALVYSIRRYGDPAYLAFTYYSINRKGAFIKKHPQAWRAVEEFMGKAEPELAVLFGSYSKGGANAGSDIDMLCICGNRKAEKIALSLRHKYNLKISPVIVSKEEFRNIRADNPELWGEIVRFGVVLKGQELFYDLVYPFTLQYLRQPAGD
ncbi:MAG: nucleotidyltransferase domain-containing protein [Candidatus Diapherotrites archaeon]